MPATGGKNLLDTNGKCRCCEAKRKKQVDTDAPRPKDKCISAHLGAQQPGCIVKRGAASGSADAKQTRDVPVSAPMGFTLLPSSPSAVTNGCMASFLARGRGAVDSAAAPTAPAPLEGVPPPEGGTPLAKRRMLEPPGAAASGPLTPELPARCSARSGGEWGVAATAARASMKEMASAERRQAKVSMEAELLQLRKQVLAMQTSREAAAAEARAAEAKAAEAEALAARTATALEAWTEVTVERALAHNKSLRIGTPLADASVRAVIKHTRSGAVAKMKGAGKPPSHNLTLITFPFPAPPPNGEAPFRAAYFTAGASLLLADWRELDHCRFTCPRCKSEAVEVPYHEKDADGAKREQCVPHPASHPHHLLSRTQP